MALHYQETNEAERWLFEAWTNALLQSLEAMTGERPEIERSLRGAAGVNPAFREAPFWWEQPLNLGDDAKIWVGASQVSWFDIGRRALGAAGIDDGSREDCLSTYREILSQSLSGTAQALSRRFGKEIVCEGGKESSPPPAELTWFALVMLRGEPDSPPIYAVLSPALTKAIEEKDSRKSEERSASGRPGNGGAETDPEARRNQANDWALAPVLENSKTLDVLMEVELPVCVSFGRAQLPLRDVLKLTSGSIVELNRTITEPVEVIVNNCVIARGEVVVIEGNYGVRIHQIVSREERLRTLH